MSRVTTMLCTFIFLLSACASLGPQQKITLSSGVTSFDYHLANGPVVVFQSGLGNDKTIWSSVIKKLPVTQAYIAYDRYGYGASSASNTLSRNPCNIAKEQHELLEKLGARPPYILVGHSIGGLYEYVFALMYPQDVAGLILLDPTHPQHWKTMQADASAAATMLKTLRYLSFSMVMRDEFDAQTECLATVSVPLEKSISANTRLFVSTKGASGAFLDVKNKLQYDWLHLLGIDVFEPVEDSGHYIQSDRPDVVVQAIALATKK